MNLEKLEKKELENIGKYINMLEKFWKIYSEEFIPGNLYMFADCFLNLEDIKTVLKHDLSFNDFLTWYDALLYDEHRQNLETFCTHGFIGYDYKYPSNYKNIKTALKKEIANIKKLTLETTEQEANLIIMICENLVKILYNG